MKRLICTLLALMMVFGSLFVLSACDEKDKDKDDKATEENTEQLAPEIPEGYELYENDDIAFVYPTGWSKTELAGGAGVMLLDGNTGNNITALGEQYSDIYKTMTVDEFNKLMKPTLEAQGMTISGVKIEQVKGKGDLAITKISYSVKAANGTSMKQTIYVVPAGSLNYAINVTSVKTVDGLLDNVFNSLTVKK
ncbi:MAG: hypothetical protein IJX19_01465 [Clostridia bacterium]|nr:hypothetical protein [Clostridia bacterium]